MSPPFWINGALRSVIWLGAAGGLAYFKKPDGASFLAVRTDAAGWLGGGIVLAGLAFHFWSSVTLGRGERPGVAASTPVTDGPFQYVRNPIYLAGITLLLGVRSSRARSSPRRFFPSPTACIAEAHCKSSCRQGPGRSCLAFDSAPQTS